MQAMRYKKTQKAQLVHHLFENQLVWYIIVQLLTYTYNTQVNNSSNSTTTSLGSVVKSVWSSYLWTPIITTDKTWRRDCTFWSQINTVIPHCGKNGENKQEASPTKVDIYINYDCHQRPATSLRLAQ